MHLLKSAALLLLILHMPVAGFARQHKYVPADSTVAFMRKLDSRLNAQVVGMILPDFMATMEDGSIFNNASLRGKVSLLFLWYPGCNGCLQADMVSNLLKLAKEHKDFQMVSILADTAELAQYRSRYGQVIPYANIHSWAECGKLNGRGGIPSCVLVNRDGSIARVCQLLSPNFFDEPAFVDKVKELLMF